MEAVGKDKIHDTHDLSNDMEKLYNGKFIKIPAKYFKLEGRHTIHIEFENKYRSDGTGLHCYNDPVDKK